MLAAVARQPLDLGAPQHGSLALDLPTRAEVAEPAPSSGWPAGDEPEEVVASEDRDVATVDVRTVQPRCLDGVACRVWQVDLLTGTDPGAIMTDEDVIVVPSVRGMRAYDARTGAPRWSVVVRLPLIAERGPLDPQGPAGCWTSSPPCHRSPSSAAT
jgi:hypothetical protein